MIANRKSRISAVLFCAMIFLCMFVFFYCFHPLVILDADDWQYVSYVRPAIPYQGFWNPSRILPEILMPLCGTAALALYRIFPMAGYIESQALVFGITLSVFITVYVWAFVRLMEVKFLLPRSYAMLLGVMFLSLHFLIFRTEESGNLYMFSSYDTCCYFYYTIPALLNCSLVMYFSCSDLLHSFFTGDRLIRKAFLVLIIYFAVFSNLFNSIILAAYLGVGFLADLAHTIRHKTRFSELLKKDLFQLLIIFLWLIAVFFESQGGRASDGWDNSGYFSAVFSVLCMLPGIVKRFSLIFVLIAVGSVAAFSFVNLTSRKDGTAADQSSHLSGFFRLHLFSPAVMILFLALLCARVNTSYFDRPQVMFGFIFSLFVILVSCIAYVIRKYRNLVIILPLFILFIISVTNTQEITFAPSNSLGLSEQICLSVDNDLVSQMIRADTDGIGRLNLEVMDTGVDDNWPHTSYIAFGLKQTLLKHGIITKNFEIVPEMSKDFNSRNRIPVSQFWPEQYRAFYPTLY